MYFTTQLPKHAQKSQPWNTENLELEAQKSGYFSKNLEIDLYLDIFGAMNEGGHFYGVEHEKDISRVW